MEMQIADIPPSINKVLRMHWTKRKALLEAWGWMVRVAWGHPLVVTNGKRRVTITLHHSRFYDQDNAYGACKVIFDALKSQGFLVDDSPEWLEAIVKQEKCKRKERRTVIELSGIL
jgi:hypothetical protein